MEKLDMPIAIGPGFKQLPVMIGKTCQGEGLEELVGQHVRRTGEDAPEHTKQMKMTRTGRPRSTARMRPSSSAGKMNAHADLDCARRG